MTTDQSDWGVFISRLLSEDGTGEDGVKATLLAQVNFYWQFVFSVPHFLALSLLHDLQVGRENVLSIARVVKCYT